MAVTLGERPSFWQRLRGLKEDPARPLRKLAARRFIDKYGLRVVDGPFAGMQYIERAYGSAFCPKLVGSYEEELHGFLSGLSPDAFDTVVDVGSAEGYYAVGLARLFPEATVLAFDIDDEANQACRALAERNGVQDRVQIKNECTPEVLAQMDLERALLLVDCEGYEDVLLDPAAAPSLNKATMVVEIHDCYVPGLSQSLKERFSPTHEVTILRTTGRDLSRYPALKALPAFLRRWAVDECRLPSAGASNYGVFIPKAG
jgi:hypothetical protein